MKSSQKKVVTGVFGGLAAVAVAGGAAFACTADATVGVVQADAIQTGSVAVEAGSTVTFAGKSFAPASESDQRMIVVTLTNPYTNAVISLGSHPGPNFVIKDRYIDPSQYFDSGTNMPYKLTAHQPGWNTRSTDVYVKGGQPWNPSFGTRTNGKAVAESKVSAPPAATLASNGGTTAAPGTQEVVGAPQAGGQAAAVPAASASAAPAVQPGGSAPAVPGPATASVAPLAPTGSSEDATPPAAELWSGLKADSSLNLLDPAAGTTPSSGGTPAAGMALLGAGILSLAGVALESTRRRLVLSRVARRR